MTIIAIILTRFIFSKMLWTKIKRDLSVPSLLSLPGSPSPMTRPRHISTPPLVWKRNSMNLPKREELLFRTVHASAGGELMGKIPRGLVVPILWLSNFRITPPKKLKWPLKRGHFKRIQKEIYSRPTIMFEKKNSSFQREYLKQAKFPLKPWLWCEKEYLKDTQFCP